MVLVVEDDAPIRRLVAEILVDSGYGVEVAANAEEALGMCEKRVAREETIDLLLSDVIMPGMGGRELATRLRHLYPHLPVLFMSGYDEHSGIGGDEAVIIWKPFSASALARRVRAALDAR